MILKTMPGQKRFAESVELAADLPIYDAFFDFTGGNVSVEVFDDQVELGSVSVVSGEKWLFLGERHKHPAGGVPEPCHSALMGGC